MLNVLSAQKSGDYLLAYEHVSGKALHVHSPDMEWKDVQRHYIVVFNRLRKAGETQDTVAARGKIPQGKISELMTSAGQGPKAENLFKALTGLGMPLSDFFREIEQARATVSAGQTNADTGNSTVNDIRPSLLGDGDQGAAVPSTTNVAALAEAGDLLISAGTRLLDAARGAHADRADPTVRKTGDAKSKRSARGAAHRRSRTA